jgi:hypothetical protein
MYTYIYFELCMYRVISDVIIVSTRRERFRFRAWCSLSSHFADYDAWLVSMASPFSR